MSPLVHVLGPQAYTLIGSVEKTERGYLAYPVAEAEGLCLGQGLIPSLRCHPVAGTLQQEIGW